MARGAGPFDRPPTSVSTGGPRGCPSNRAPRGPRGVRLQHVVAWSMTAQIRQIPPQAEPRSEESSWRPRFRSRGWALDTRSRSRDQDLRSAQNPDGGSSSRRLALRDRARSDIGGDITPDTRGNVLAEAWSAGSEDLGPITAVGTDPTPPVDQGRENCRPPMRRTVAGSAPSSRPSGSRRSDTACLGAVAHQWAAAPPRATARRRGSRRQPGRGAPPGHRRRRRLPGEFGIDAGEAPVEQVARC